MTHQSFENRQRLALHHARGMQLQYQRVLLLRNEGMSDLDTAEHEGVSDSTIKNRLSPPRRRLRCVCPRACG